MKRLLVSLALIGGLVVLAVVFSMSNVWENLGHDVARELLRTGWRP